MPDARERLTWMPSLEGRSGPRYRAIADILQEDIASGRLDSGQRLPTHRELAYQLGVTVGTVTRAYVEAERRGLITGEVGRGTFVRPDMSDYAEPGEAETRYRASNETDNRGPIDLSGNAPPTPPLADRIATTFAEIAQDEAFTEFLRYRPSQGMAPHAAAGAAWIKQMGLTVDPKLVIPTNGAQHGMVTAISAAAGAGEWLLCDNLVFFGLKALARFLGLRLQGIEIDEEGLVPEALETAIKATGARALYTCPTIQNPTCGIMSIERREAIAAICARHGVTIIEDDIYNFLLETPMPPLATFLPEQTVYLANLSKPLAPALRVGYLAGPRHLVAGLLTGIRATGVMVSPLMHEVGARLIWNGTAIQNAALVRQQAMRRQGIARRYLGNWDIRSQAASLHLWLTLPEAWGREAFTAECLRRGVSVASGELFAVSRQNIPHAVRLSVTGPRSDEELERGLSVVRDLLRSDEVMTHHLSAI